MSIREILSLSNIQFLQALVLRYPEMAYLLGEATASPEGNQTLKTDALVFQVFPERTIADTAIEYERTAMGLLCFKAVMQGDSSLFPSLSQDVFNQVRYFTISVVTSEEDVEFILYSLACNDLGKTHAIAQQAHGNDHDQILYDLVCRNQSLFAGMNAHLTPIQVQMYAEGLGANLNLGQYVQGENLPWNLQGMQRITAKARNLRLVAELFDFAGVTGHITHTKSLVMNDDNAWAFMTAIQQLMIDPLDKAYARYIARRAERVGIDASTDEVFALGRLAAMARFFTVEQGQVLQQAWTCLADKDRDALLIDLNATGFGQKGILVYYAPALLANTLKATSPETGLPIALAILAKVYKREAATRHDFTGDGVVTVDVNQMAKECASDPQAVLASLGV